MLKVNSKFKSFVKYNCLLLIMLFIIVIMLYEKAHNTIYIVCLTTACSSFLIGQNNGLSLFDLGIGQTRKQIELKLIKQLIFLIVYAIIIIFIDVLFILIVVKTINIKISIILFTFLISLVISQISLFITLNLDNKKNLLLGSIIISCIIILSFIISNKIVSDLILIIFIALSYYFNRYMIYHKEIK